MDEQKYIRDQKDISQQLSWMARPIPKVCYTFACGDDRIAHWHVRTFKLEEGLSTPYAMTLELTTSHTEIDPESLLGDSCSLLIDRSVMQRSVHGIIDQVRSLGMAADRLMLRIRVVPALNLLKQRINTRSWQDRTVPEILQEVIESAFAGYKRDVRLMLRESYAKRDFCVQYRESDYDFACRLMEEEGIYYYFEHDGEHGSETLILIDHRDCHRALELVGDDDEIPIIETSEGTANVESIQSLEWCCTLHSTSVVQRDYSWLAPSSASVNEIRGSDPRGREREVYDPEERRIHEIVTGAKTASMVLNGSRQAQIKHEEIAALGKQAHGQSNVIELTPGYTFTLQGHHISELDRRYLLIRVQHSGDMPEENILEGAAHAGGPRYENSFECIPLEIAFRPPRIHQRPKIYGPQTALVTGPAGEEVHTDEQGRIKVLFRWDRLSSADDSSSFWVRVAQNWAGAGWGTWFLPRIGMEVVVEFLDGNPDRPLVTGCVYNGVNSTPYPLPDEKTKSTIKSNSSLGGGGFNEFRFEDAKGKEEIYLHGQKDWNITILNNKSQSIGHDETGSVGHDRSRQVGNNETISIGVDHTQSVGNNRSRQVGNNETISIGANQTETVGINRMTNIGANDTENIGANQTILIAANQSLNIGSSQSVKIGGAYNLNVAKASAEMVGLAKALTVGAAYQVSVAGAKNETVGLSNTEQVGVMKQITAGNKIEFVCGSSKMILEKSGKVTIEGTEFSFKSSGPVTINGSVIDLN